MSESRLAHLPAAREVEPSLAKLSSIDHAVEPWASCWWGIDQKELDRDHGDCIENHLDYVLFARDDEGNQLPRSEWPKTVTIEAWTRRVLKVDDIPDLDSLDAVLEALDEAHGSLDPFTGAIEPPYAMREAFGTDHFAAVMVAEYFVYQCDPLADLEVDVMEWIRAENPEWLDEDEP